MIGVQPKPAALSISSAVRRLGFGPSKSVRHRRSACNACNACDRNLMAKIRRLASNLILARPMEMPARSVKSAMRVLEVFELLNEVRQPLTIAEIAASLGYPFSSTAALVHTLTKSGYLLTDGTRRRYLPSLRITVLGHWPNQKFGWNDRILALMEELYETAKLSVTLHCRNGLFSQFVHVVEDPDRTEWHVWAGMVRRLTATASGRVLLSVLPQAEAMRIIRRLNADATEAAEVVDIPALAAEMAEIRRAGYLYTHNVSLPGTAYIGVPLLSADGDQPLVVGLGGHSEQIDPRRDELVDTLLATIARYGRR